MTYRPIRPARLYEQIVEQIERQILNGDLQAGDKLPTENELAEHFDVSRTSVREAIKTLAQQGLVEVKVGRGTFVTDHTSQVVKHSLDLMMRFNQQDGSSQIVEVREILEPEIAARAAARVTEEDITAMREAVETMDANMDDPVTFIAADHEFHMALARGTQNELVLALADSIVDVLQEQRMHIYRVEGGPQRGQSHHKRILQAIESRDSEAARAEMEAHLQQVKKDSATPVEE